MTRLDASIAAGVAGAVVTVTVAARLAPPAAAAQPPAPGKTIVVMLGTGNPAIEPDLSEPG